MEGLDWRADVAVYLTLKSTTLTASEISKLVGMECSRSIAIGDPILGLATLAARRPGSHP